MSRILVIDDEPTICWGIKQLARSMGHEVEVVASAEQGLKLAASNKFDLVLLDVRLPGIDGLTAMPRFRQLLPPAPIVVMTAFGDLGTAVRAVQNGAFEYLLKPFDLAEVRATINRAFAASPSSVPNDERPAGEMIGQSPAMQAVFKRIALAASSNVAVLLQGETGVGKEEAAFAIHRHSTRSGGPFIVVDLAALSPSMAEAELFGPAVRSSMDQSHTRNGLLAEADRGTLFLKEVSNVPMPVQAKLLRALDQGVLQPIGADRSRSADFRIISATSKNLPRLAESGEFRRDLIDRLCEFEITIPPLRERAEDILLLAHHFAEAFRGENVTFTEQMEQELMQRKWFGNLPELRSAIEYALAQAPSGNLLPEHLPAPLPTTAIEQQSTGRGDSLEDLARHRAADLLNDPDSEGFVYERFLEEVEPALLQSAMDRYANEYAPAARALGLHRTTLKRKLDQYGMGK